MRNLDSFIKSCALNNNYKNFSKYLEELKNNKIISDELKLIDDIKHINMLNISKKIYKKIRFKMIIKEMIKKIV